KHVGVVLDLDRFLRLLVLFGVRFGFALHPLDFIFRKTRTAGDRYFLLPPGAKVFRAHVQDAVGVDVESDFDLRHAARRRRDTIKMEYAQLLVVAAQWA